MKHAFKCLLLALIVVPQITAAQNAFARKGFLDLRQWNFEEGAVNLTGEWEIYMSELRDPSAFTKENKAQADYIDFPSTWNKYSQSLTPGEGYATYHLKVLVRKPKLLALELPHFYSNYSLWVNSKPVASNGNVGTSAKTSKPQWLPQTITLNPHSDTLDIVIQASNFHHAKGGVREHIILGNSGDLFLKRQIAVGSNVTMFVILLAIALTFILFFISRKEISMIYFAGLSVTWSVRSVFSNQYVATSFFPELPWELCVKIEYVSLYLMMIWAILFLGSIFKNDVSITLKYLFGICNTVFIILTLYFKAALYTQFLPVYLSFAAGLLIYVIYVLVRAVLNERQGAWLMVSSLFLGVILFSYDLISYQGFATFNPIILNIGYITMFILMGLTLLLQAGYLKRSSGHGNVLTYDELFGAKETE